VQKYGIWILGLLTILTIIIKVNKLNRFICNRPRDYNYFSLFLKKLSNFIENTMEMKIIVVVISVFGSNLKIVRTTNDKRAKKIRH